LLTGFYYHSKQNAQVAIFRCSIPEDAEIKLSFEHSDFKWMNLSELSEVQLRRALDAMDYELGQVVSRAF
jgi:8-oxo-dGTP diphosphatase